MVEQVSTLCLGFVIIRFHANEGGKLNIVMGILRACLYVTTYTSHGGAQCEVE